MSSNADRRDTRRIIVGSDFAIAFTLGGHDYRDVRISNISTGGCFALVGLRDARLFERGAVIEGLVLLHPELPKAPLRATVSYVLGGRPGGNPLELIGIGIQFVGVPEAAQKALDTWLDAASVPRQG
ncbi:MAG TPA: PilZ domain-containing protein [Geothrix sp.]